MTLSHMRIGINVGRTKITGVVLAPDDEMLAEMRLDMPQDDYDATLMAIADIVTELEKMTDRGTASVGVGIPGSILPRTGLSQNFSFGHLNKRPVRDDLTKLLRRLVRCANSANCFVVSEAFGGAGTGAKSVFGATLGMSCSGGFFINRRLASGPRVTASEWSHNPLLLPAESRETSPDHHHISCWCGMTDCIETTVSAGGISRDFAAETGLSLSVKDIVTNHWENPKTRVVLERHARRLAMGLAMVVNIIDPEVIVLGGGLSHMKHLYADLPRLMAPYILSQEDRMMDIRPSMYGASSRARGAARLWEMG